MGDHGDLVLKGLPFEPGQQVDVLVVSKAGGAAASGRGSLRESVLEFREPTFAVILLDTHIRDTARFS